MWHFKYLTTFIFVFGFVECEYVNEKSCHENKITYEWQRENNSQPGVLYAITIFRDEPRNSNLYNNIIVMSLKRRENFNLTVLVKPSVKNQAECPPDPNTEIDLRKFWAETRFPKVESEMERPRYFPKAYTGCYYFIMTNDQNQHWLTNIIHFKTDQAYFDTMVRCNSSVHFNKFGTNCNSKRLQLFLRIPMKCLKLRIDLFELEDQNPDTLKKCESREIPAKNTCWLSLNNCIGTKANVTVECEKSKEVNVTEAYIPLPEMSTCGIDDDSWNTEIFWRGLRADGAYYYSTFSGLYTCNDAWSSDLTTWEIATKIGIMDHKWSNSTECEVYESSQQKFSVVIIIFISMAVILILIAIYWIAKLIRNCLYQKKSSWKKSNVMVSVLEEDGLCDVKKSTDLLLVYSRDSDEFTKAVDDLRENLKQKCSFQIRDIYSNNELQKVSNLTVPLWIEKMMRSGCKIVWIDTPKFRSRLNDDKSNEECLNADCGFDFRDTSVRYAVNLVKTTFENETQYRRHFVLRIKGFDEFNGVEDPLLTISPYVRYHYPEHIDNLCEHLNK